MNILSVDTATEVLGVAVRSNGGEFTGIIRKVGLKHAELVMPTVEYVLSQAGVPASELDLLVCAKGPGSFTGLRIGMSTVKGLAAGLEKPFVSVPTLDAMAYANSSHPATVVPIIDGKKRRVYLALFQNGRRISDYMDKEIEDAKLQIGEHDGALLTGPGSEMAYGILHESIYVQVDPVGACGWNLAYLELGKRLYDKHGGDDVDSGPFYIRKSDAEIKRQERQLGATRPQ